MLAQHRTSSTIAETYHRPLAGNAGAEFQRIYDLVVVTLPDTLQPQRQRTCLAPRRYLPLFEYVRHHSTRASSQKLGYDDSDLIRAAEAAELPLDRVRSMLMDGAITQPFGKPFVVRAGRGDILLIRLTNKTTGQPVRLALVDDDYGMQTRYEAPGDGAEGSQTYEWRCHQPGIYPIFNEAAQCDAERRCLLGVLIVEP